MHPQDFPTRVVASSGNESKILLAAVPFHHPGVRPKKFRFLSGVLRVKLAAFLFLSVCLTAHLHAGEFVFHYENVLGTSAELRIHSASRIDAGAAEQRALAEIDRLTAIVSTYDSQSELRRWMNGDVNKTVSSDLFDLLSSCDQYEKLTQGAFNPRVASATSLWKQAAENGVLPSDVMLRKAAQKASRPAWLLDESNRTAKYLHDRKCELSLDAIAKGFIIDQAAEAAMAEDGVDGVVVNIGGDLVVRGDISQRVGISDPAEETRPISVVRLERQAIATSGGYQRFFEIQGRRYSHLIDPRSGYPVTKTNSVSVIAPSAMAADVAATALSVMSIDDALAWCEANKPFECLIVDSQGNLHRSRNWPPTDDTIHATQLVATETGEWPKGAKLTVSFELNRQSSGRYHRPYVAVWVEDSDGYPRRTLILWLQEGKGERWHRDLKRWYVQDLVRQVVDETELIGTISAATRPPGKYKAVWDGKDDNGKFVPPGKYTLYLEAAREHGTYQIMKTPITIGDKEQNGTLKGNVEIKSASFKYETK